MAQPINFRPFVWNNAGQAVGAAMIVSAILIIVAAGVFAAAPALRNLFTQNFLARKGIVAGAIAGAVLIEVALVGIGSHLLLRVSNPLDDVIKKELEAVKKLVCKERWLAECATTADTRYREALSPHFSPNGWKKAAFCDITI